MLCVKFPAMSLGSETVPGHSKALGSQLNMHLCLVKERKIKGDYLRELIRSNCWKT